MALPNGTQSVLRPRGMTRRTAIGSMVTAIAVPTLLSRAWAGDNPSPSSLLQASPTPRQQHTTTSLNDGRILVAGGRYLAVLSSVQILDPSTGTWYTAAPLNIPRFEHAAVLLSNGAVMVTGGQYESILSATEIYNPNTDTWTIGSPMSVPRSQHDAVALRDGRVLVTGGVYQSDLTSVDVFNGVGWSLS
jgi:hypothetical protein